MGYGSCWMTAPVLAAPAIEGLLGVQDPMRLVAVVPIGRPATTGGGPTSRHPLSDVLEFR
jgi:nitroreductase